MAEPTKRPAKKAAAPKKPVYENLTYLDREPSEVQVGFADYITKTTGHTVPVGDVALVLRLYPIYLKTPEIVAARDVEKAERERIKAVKEAERKARLQAKLDKINADRAKLLADLGISDDGFEEPEHVEPADEPEPVVDLAAKREKARQVAAAAVAAEPEPEGDDEAAWEGDDEFGDAGEEVSEPVTLAPTTDDDEAGLWDDSGDDGEEDF